MSIIRRHTSRQKTPWDDEPVKTPLQDFLTQHYRQHYQDKHPSLSKTGEADLINTFVPDDCPFCSSPSYKMFGHTRNGIQRYRCLACGKTFTPITGTIYDGHKISVSEWMEYILNIFRYISITADSWNNKNAFTTSRYWLEKLFLVLDDYQQNIVLSDTVWLDETYYKVRSNDIVLTTAGKRMRGISANQLCIGVACDNHRAVCIWEGNGKPTQKKTYEAFKNHITVGSTLIHDKENAHKLLIKKLGLIDKAYDAKAIKALPDSKNPLNRVNQVHARMKDFLNAHSSFNRDSLQGYLNLFTFAMNPPVGYLEKVEELLILTFKVRKTLRYRDFYAVK